MKKLLFLMPYFGRWPEWFAIYLASCAHNPQFDWLFFTDCDPPLTAPQNVRFIRTSLAELSALFSKKLQIHVSIDRPIKICDFRLAFGHVFSDYLKGYSSWGFGDIDVVYGDLSQFLTEEALTHDLITFHADYISGHLCVLRNDPKVVSLFTRLPQFFEKLQDEQSKVLDEWLFPGGRRWSSLQVEFPHEVMQELNFLIQESYPCPFSWTVPWVDGTDHFPIKWYWLHGRLTNEYTGERSFPYLHFVCFKHGSHLLTKRLKGDWRELKTLVYLEPHEIEDGVMICCDKGFHPLSGVRPVELIAPKGTVLTRRLLQWCKMAVRDIKRRVRARLPISAVRSVWSGIATRSK